MEVRVEVPVEVEMPSHHEPTGRTRPAPRGARRGVVAAAVALSLLAPALVTLAQGGNLRLSGLHGEVFDEASLSQGTTIVVVWASWSPRCRDIVDRVAAVQRGWGGKARVITVSFNEDRKAVEDFLAAKAMPVPVFLDSDGGFSKKHAVTTLPGLLVFKDGATAYGGKLPEDPASVLDGILR